MYKFRSDVPDDFLNLLLTGQYKFCFNVPGDYFYWSGYVNDPYNTIYLRGQVTVTARTSSLVDLKVKVGGVDAAHDTGKWHTRKRAAFFNFVFEKHEKNVSASNDQC